MADTVEFAKAYNDFLKLSDEFRDFTLQKAEFKETVLAGVKKVERRPIVLINNGNARRSIDSRLTKWMAARDTLNRLAPERFPLSSSLFNPEPTIIREVQHAQVYVNKATVVRDLNVNAHLKRLERTRKIYLAKPESGFYEEEVAAIDKEIAYFKENISKKFRQRQEDYTEVVIAVTHTNGAEKKYKVHDGGIYLYSSSVDKPVTLLQPDQMPQAQRRQKRKSIYDSIAPIKSVLPLPGKLYLLNDITAAQNEKARLEHKLAYRKDDTPIK